VITVYPLIAEAKRILKESPYDVAHDLSHHERVWKNAQRISEHVSEPFDEDILKVAVFWHDVTLGQKSETEDRTLHIQEAISHLRDLMKRHSFPLSFQESVQEVIRSHVFEAKNQATIEAKILFDADKLDAFHQERYTALLNAYKGRQLSKMKVFLLVQAAKLWLRTVRNRYHFDISRAMHDERISHLLQDTEAVQTAKSLGVDIEKLVK
jgi:HD superfamily phosphodiesterase